MEYKNRQELNELSLKAFGASSRWQKLVKKGIPQAYERDREVMIVEKNGSLGKKLFTDRKVEIKRFTIEEVKKHMMQILEDCHHAEKKQAEAIAAAAAARGESILVVDAPRFTEDMEVTGKGIPVGTKVKSIK